MADDDLVNDEAMEAVKAIDAAEEMPKRPAAELRRFSKR